jgi:hypothetical protein
VYSYICSHNSQYSLFQTFIKHQEKEMNRLSWRGEPFSPLNETAARFHLPPNHIDNTAILSEVWGVDLVADGLLQSAPQSRQFPLAFFVAWHSGCSQFFRRPYKAHNFHCHALSFQYLEAFLWNVPFFHPHIVRFLKSILIIPWSVCLWPRYVDVTITILDIIHRRVFYLKHDVSETRSCLRL